MTTASIILLLIGTYLLIGLMVGVAFALVGVVRVDPAASQRGRAWRRFRALLIPGATALWPLVASRWITATKAPNGVGTPPPPTRSMRPERRIHLVAWCVLTPLLLVAVAWAWNARDVGLTGKDLAGTDEPGQGHKPEAYP